MPDTAPVYLPCIACHRTAAVVQPPRLGPFARGMVETMVDTLGGGELTPDLRAEGTVFGMSGEQAAQLLNVRCPRCYIAGTTQADGASE